MSTAPIKRAAADMTREDIAQQLREAFPVGPFLDAAQRQKLPPSDYASAGVEFWQPVTVTACFYALRARYRSLVLERAAAIDLKFVQARAAAEMAQCEKGGSA